MISILLVDDDPLKVKKILDLLRSVPEILQDKIKVADDLITARDMVRKYHFDLLILDIKLPNRKGDEPLDFGGCEFIKELISSQTLLRPFHIIGLTQYKDILDKVDPFFYDETWRVIQYDPQTINWKTQLRSKIQYLIQSKRELVDPSNLPYSYDIAVITALVNPELTNILSLPGQWIEVHVPNDTTIYHTGVLSSNGKNLMVVAASAHQMGIPAAAVLSMKIQKHFRPHYLVMTGLAAGVAGNEGKMGDILIADQTWDYQSGKIKLVDSKEVFEPDPKSIPLNHEIKEKFQHFTLNRDCLDAIKSGWPKDAPDSQLNVLIGPLASGGAVIDNPKLIERIQSGQRKLIGIDMETYGVFYAADNCPNPKPLAISIKSICDFACGKTDQFQAYAAYTSAQYFYQFAINKIEPIIR